MQSHSATRSGFTLTEMAISIGVISLIIGAILSGKHLLDAAEMNKSIEKITQLSSATRHFRQKYNALPGDMGDATRYFPSASTQNGGHNGHISHSQLSGAPGDTESQTEYANWAQHLMLAGLLKGNYTGYTGWQAAGSLSVADTTHPPGQQKNSIIWAGYLLAADANVFNSLQDKNVLVMEGSGAGWNAPKSLLTPEEMRNFDLKFDDGSPARGKIGAFTSAGSANCTQKTMSNSAASTSSDTEAVYKLSYKDSACVLLSIDAY